MQFATWVRQRQRSREWNDADLARRLKVPQATVSRWLRGERRPDPKSCDLIADVFGVEVEEVLTLVGHLPSVAPPKRDDERDELVSLVKRVKLKPDRVSGLRHLLQGWAEDDRAACNGAAGVGD